MTHIPFDILIHPSGPLDGRVAAPPSKNYTTRTILAAALADGASQVRRPATNDDARALVRCLRSMGATIDESGGDLTIRGVAGRPKNPGRINPDNAGAVLRLLLGVGCLIPGEVVFETEHTDSLGRRPNEDLLDALRQLGAEAQGTDPEGTLPIRICGDRIRGGQVRVSGARSSQYLSSLLFLTPHLAGNSTIVVGEADPAIPPRLVSAPLIDQTLEVLGRVGLRIQADLDALHFSVPGNQCASAGEWTVNADWPSAAALLAAVASAGGDARIEGLLKDAQGERRAVDCLAAMGCRLTWASDGVLEIKRSGPLRATTFNGDLATDAVLALLGAACLAEGTSRFNGIANLRLKECDRIAEPLEELAKLGVEARSGEDWIEVTGRPDGYEGGVEVDSRGDHRVAQLLAIVGLRCRRGLRIRRAEHIAKSYPSFFDDLARLGAGLESVAPTKS